MSEDSRQRPDALACPNGVQPETLSAWRDGLLPLDQAARFERHTPGCLACRERLRDYDAAASALASQVIPRPGADLWPGARDAIEREMRGAAGGNARRALHLPRGLALGGLGAGIAALLLVALFAGLLISHKPGRPTLAATPGATQTETAITTATTTSPDSKWTAVTDLNTVATIAPAQLRTRFKAFAGQTSKTTPPEIWVRRSDDYGVTYHDVSLPPIPGGATATNITFLEGAQSPLNPSVYFLTAQTQTRCTGGPCQYQYVTMDGGATWRALNLPAHGLLGTESVSGTGIFAQGQRLYGVVTDIVLNSSGVVPPGRLVVSDDGGATWSVADAAIFAANQWIYNVAPTPGNATVFALAGQNFGAGLPAHTPALSVWRSDNAGATWTQEGPLPGAYALGVEAAVNPTTGKPTLYALVGDASDDFHLYASSDGGATWPATYDFHQGRDLSAPNAFPGLIGTFADGAVAIASYDYSTLAWDPTTGTPVTIFPAPPSGVFIQSEILTPPNSLGVEYIWIVSQDSQGNTVYYYTSAQ